MSSGGETVAKLVDEFLPLMLFSAHVFARCINSDSSKTHLKKENLLQGQSRNPSAPQLDSITDTRILLDCLEICSEALRLSFCRVILIP